MGWEASRPLLLLVPPGAVACAQVVAGWRRSPDDVRWKPWKPSHLLDLTALGLQAVTRAPGWAFVLFGCGMYSAALGLLAVDLELTGDRAGIDLLRAMAAGFSLLGAASAVAAIGRAAGGAGPSQWATVSAAPAILVAAAALGTASALLGPVTADGSPAALLLGCAAAGVAVLAVAVALADVAAPDAPPVVRRARASAVGFMLLAASIAAAAWSGVPANGPDVELASAAIPVGALALGHAWAGRGAARAAIVGVVIARVVLHGFDSHDVVWPVTLVALVGTELGLAVAGGAHRGARRIVPSIVGCSASAGVVAAWAWTKAWGSSMTLAAPVPWLWFIVLAGAGTACGWAGGRSLERRGNTARTPGWLHLGGETRVAINEP